MREYIDYQKSICNRGNLYRIKQVMKRAVAGEEITVGFIGGSITQGSLATNSTNCYAYKTFEWWKENFKDANFTYINAGILTLVPPEWRMIYISLIRILLL